MGTRAIIVFSNTDNAEFDEGVPIYQHYDGYPSNVLHTLRQYLDVNNARIDDTPYLASGFLRYVENYKYLPHIPDRFQNLPDDDYENKDPYTGFGIIPQKLDEELFEDGWMDYFYMVTPKRVFMFNSSIDKEKNLKKMYEVDIETLLEMPDENQHFEELERKILPNYYDEF